MYIKDIDKNAKNFTALIAVEGKDDETFLDSFYFQGTIPAGYVVCNIEGVDVAEFGDFIQSQLKSSSNALKKFALIVDADDNPSARRQEIQRMFQRLHGARAPFEAIKLHTLNNGLVAGFFCLPDNSKPGGLEDLVFEACCSEPYLTYTEELLAKSAIIRKDFRLTPFRHVKKRKMQVYLATQQKEPPEKPYLCNGIGFAVKKGILTVQNRHLFSHLEQFLNTFCAA
jgi:5S rRNA maturation endonuclease (ribonuclease M5)